MKNGNKKQLCSDLDLSSQSIARLVLSTPGCFKTQFGKGRVGSTPLQRPGRSNHMYSYQL